MDNQKFLTYLAAIIAAENSSVKNAKDAKATAFDRITAVAAEKLLDRVYRSLNKT